MNEKEKKDFTLDWDRESNKSALKILLILSLKALYGNNRVVWLSPLLFAYGFMLLITSDIISEVYHYDGSYSKWCLVPISCLILFEVLNQFTYWKAKISRRNAIVSKAVFFWVIFTVFAVSDILLGLQGTKEGVWLFSEKWSAVLILMCISWILPAYSFCPDIRFYVLYGKFEDKLFRKSLR